MLAASRWCVVARSGKIAPILLILLIARECLFVFLPGGYSCRDIAQRWSAFLATFNEGIWNGNRRCQKYSG